MTDDGIARLQAALTGRSTIRGWAEGGQLVGLVRAAQEAGWFARLRDRARSDDLAAATGLPVDRVLAVLTALRTAGVVCPDGDAFVLTAEFAALVDGASGVSLGVVLDAVDVAGARIGHAVDPPDLVPGLDAESALRVARDWGVRPDDGARDLYGLLYESVPDYRDRLAAGGPLLDVGSGVGGALLTTVSLFPGLRAVGVEVVPDIAIEARRRAEQAGVADRVEVRVADARSLRDESAFTVAFWAQPFFPRDQRADVFAAIARALQPDGLLLMQELAPQNPDTTSAALERVIAETQGVSADRSAEALVDEAETAGFARTTIVASALGRLVLAHR